MIDTLIILVFILIWFGSLFRKEQHFQNMFGSSIPLPWWVTGFSLTVISVNATYAVLLSGLVFSSGFHALWWVFISCMGVGASAFIFSHYWARSGVKTDNQIVRIRYSGKASEILQIFRAGYVGLLVFPLLSAQMTVAFAGFLSHFTGFDYFTSLMATSVILLANVTRTTFYSKVRMDVYMGLVLGIIFMSVAIWFLLSIGRPVFLGDSITASLGAQNIFPGSETNFRWPDFMIIITVAWWSTYILDGAGLQAQRFLQMNNRRDLMIGALFQGIAMAVITFFLLIIVAAAVFYYPQLSNGEQAFFQLLTEQVPVGFRALCLVAIAIAYLTTAEAFINISGSYLMVDLLKYDKVQLTDFKKRHHTYLALVLLTLVIVFMAFFFDSVEQIFRFIIVITAGVGPVFILRWWWWRINAWSQLSAMLSSLIYAISYELAYEHWPAFQQAMDVMSENLAMQAFSWKVLLLTVMVIATWLIITFLTPADEKAHLQKFYDKVQPHGWWKPFSGSSQPSLFKPLISALLAGYALLALHFLFYTFLFGFTWLGIGIFIIAATLLWYLVRYNLKQ